MYIHLNTRTHLFRLRSNFENFNCDRWIFPLIYIISALLFPKCAFYYLHSCDSFTEIVQFCIVLLQDIKFIIFPLFVIGERLPMENNSADSIVEYCARNFSESIPKYDKINWNLEISNKISFISITNLKHPKFCNEWWNKP